MFSFFKKQKKGKITVKDNKMLIENIEIETDIPVFTVDKDGNPIKFLGLPLPKDIKVTFNHNYIHATEEVK